MIRSLLAVTMLAAATPTFAATVLKIATLAPEGTSWMKEMRTAGADVKTATAGRVELKFYPGGVMGNEATVLRKMKLGQLQGGAFAATELAGVYPDIQVYGLPFLFRSKEEADAVRQTIDPLVRSGMEQAGFVVSGITGGGFSYLFSTQEIATVDDLRKTKVWTPSNDDVARIAFERAGLTPVPLSTQDVYTSLQTGLVETAGNTPVGAIAFQWHTKLKYMFELKLNYVSGVLVFDKRSLDKLDAADQKAVNDAVGAAFNRMNENNFGEDEKALAALVKQGVKVTRPDAAEIARWQDIGDAAVAELREKQVISAAMLDATLKSLSDWRAAHP